MHLFAFKCWLVIKAEIGHEPETTGLTYHRCWFPKEQQYQHFNLHTFFWITKRLVHAVKMNWAKFIGYTMATHFDISLAENLDNLVVITRGKLLTFPGCTNFSFSRVHYTNSYRSSCARSLPWSMPPTTFFFKGDCLPQKTVGLCKYRPASTG